MRLFHRIWFAGFALAAGCSLFESGFSFKGDAVEEGDASCAHKLCADFDLGAFDAWFSGPYVSENASLNADSDASVSPPNSLLSQLHPSTSNKDFAWMERVFDGGTASSNITYTFDLRIDSWGGNDNAVALIAEILINESAPDQHSLNLIVGSGSAGLQEQFVGADGGAQSIQHPFVGPTLGTWVTMQFKLDLVNHACSATMGGNPVLATSIDPSWSAGTPSVFIGMTYASSQSSLWAVRYDNVVVDYQ